MNPFESAQRVTVLRLRSTFLAAVKTKCTHTYMNSLSRPDRTLVFHWISYHSFAHIKQKAELFTFNIVFLTTVLLWHYSSEFFQSERSRNQGAILVIGKSLRLLFVKKSYKLYVIQRSTMYLAHYGVSAEPLCDKLRFVEETMTL